MDLISLLICGGVVVFAGGLLLLVVVSSFFSSGADKKKAANWGPIASRLGLQLVDDPGSLARLEGAWRGHRTQVRVVRRHESNHGNDVSDEFVWTHIVVYWPRSADLGMSVSKLGAVMAMLGNTVGRKRIQIGDPQFERAVFVRGNDPAGVAAFLQPPLRAEVQRVAHLHDYVEFTDFGGAVTIHGWADEQEIVRWLDELAKVVDVAVAVHGA